MKTRITINRFIVEIGFIAWCIARSDGQQVTTLAGSGSTGSFDGEANIASFNWPHGVAVDSNGTVYIADFMNHKIRKITPSGQVSTLAGTGSSGLGDGPGEFATFRNPIGVASDSNGNVYVADMNNHNIRKVSPDGVVSTLAGSGYGGSEDGPGLLASFAWPCGVAVDLFGNIYVADYYNNRIRKISASGVVGVLAGGGTVGDADGFGSSALFRGPNGVAVDSSGNVYVADTFNNKIRKVTPSGEVTTLAGNGTKGSADGAGSSATFNAPTALTVDANGNIFVSDTHNHKIRKITPSGFVTTLAGVGSTGSVDGPGTASSFYLPEGIAVDKNGTLYVADCFNQKIRKISVPTSDCGCSPCPSCLQCSSNALCKTSTLSCPPGFSLSNDLKTCIECASGFFKPTAGNTDCLLCPNNAVCNASSFSCQPGYSIDAIQTGCEECLSGFFKPRSGNSSCSPCPANSVCNRTSFECSPGYSLDYNQQKCQECSAGFYKPTPGNTGCIPCPDNASCSASGFNCLPGFESSGNVCLTRKSGNIELVMSFVGTFFAVFIIILVTWIARRKLRNKSSKVNEHHESAHASMSSAASTNWSGISMEASNIAQTSVFLNATVLAVPGYLQVSSMDYRFREEINRGGFAQVFQGELIRTSLIAQFQTRTIAIKVNATHGTTCESQLLQFEKEVAIMGLLSKYPYFVQLIGFDMECLSILMRLYDQGSLKHFICRWKNDQSSEPRCTRNLILKFALDIGHGVQIMHQHHLAHCDLKPDNVLIDFDDKAREWKALLTDFGISRVDKAGQQVKAFFIPELRAASLLYAAPEVLSIIRTRQDARSFQEVLASDIYSYGCILRDMVTHSCV